MQTAATCGVVGSPGSGAIALAHSERTLRSVSAPSSAVRSIMLKAVWIARDRSRPTGNNARIFPMATETPTMQHVFRQRSSLGLAAVCGVTGLLLLLSLARNWADYPRPSFAAWVVFGLAVAWAIFVRPVVLVDIGGVTLRNV